MASVDFTVSTAQYDAMMIVLDGIRAKLATHKPKLIQMLSMENGKAKIKSFAQTEDGRWLREIWKMKDDLNAFSDEIGWDR